MADQKAPQMQATLGLTGLTSNAMALIAPGAFLWLTFFIQATTGVAGQPSTAPGMWIGIFAALVLCLATAVAYAEISKLYPGTGSSYYYAEQAMLSQRQGLQIRPHRQVHSRLGLASLLLGLSRRDGSCHRRLCWLCGRLPLSKRDERLQSRPRVYGAGRRCILVLRRMDRFEGRRRIDRCQPRHQRQCRFLR